MRIWLKWWAGLSRKRKLLCVALLLLIAAVIALGISLGFAHRNLKTAEEEVAVLQSNIRELENTLKAAERERDDTVRNLAQCQEEAEFLRERLACYIPPELTIEKLARRGSYGTWKESIEVKPGDIVQFRIIIRGIGQNVYLKDILPPEFISVTNLAVDGKPISGNISALYLSRVLGECEVSFEARLDSKLKESTTLTNQVVVWADCVEEQVSEVVIGVKVRPPTPFYPSPRPPAPPEDDCDEDGGPGPDPPPVLL